MPYDIVETDERVEIYDAELRTRFRWRAERRCQKLNKQREVNFYRYEVHQVNGKWEVWVMQNVAVRSRDE